MTPDFCATLIETSADLLRIAAELRAEQAKDRLLRAKEAARALNVSLDTLYSRANEYPFTRRLGRSLRFSEQGILRYLREGM